MAGIVGVNRNVRQYHGTAVKLIAAGACQLAVSLIVVAFTYRCDVVDILYEIAFAVIYVLAQFAVGIAFDHILGGGDASSWALNRRQSSQTSDYRIIISATAIVEACFAIVIIISISEGISVENVRVSGKVSSVNTVAPSIILTPSYLKTCFVEKSNGSIRI